jgi:pyruvate/2-oxoglutarate dehydrogenase complex dihydrolipoamide dehydrogenase (E3) component
MRRDRQWNRSGRPTTGATYGRDTPAGSHHGTRSSNRGIEQSLEIPENCRSYEGHARLASPHEEQAGSEILTSDQTFINVGARAAVPDIPGLDRVYYLANSSMTDFGFLPRHVLVQGGGYVGCKFGQLC